ncbi:MAG TPA: aspartyl protease family protein [Rhodanobacteraceae bacterium]|nr:aspartyl protease family protein [Rhodanobacteraceae bacterium]
MRSAFLVIAGAVLVSVLGAAHAATDPATVLNAYRAASGGDAWHAKAVMKTESKLTGQGLTGTDTSITDLRTGNSVERYTLGPASGAEGFDGKDAWEQGPNGEVNLQKGGDGLQLARNVAYQNANLWWRADFGGAKVEALADRPCGKSTCAALEIAPKGGLPFQAWFDRSSHLLDRTVLHIGARTTTVLLSDYRSVDGVRVPFKTVVDNGHGQQYLQTVTVTSVTFLPGQPVATYAPPASHIKDVAIANGATQTMFPFRLLNNHIYTDAWVNGQGPLLFIVDTGGENILVPSTAKVLGLKTEGAMAGTGVGSKTVSVGLAKVKSLKVGKAAFKDQIVYVMDFIPNNVEGVDVEGMLGFTVFKRFVTRIDYGKHEITLIEPDHFDPKDAGTPIPFVFNGDLPEVEGTFDGIRGKFDIDTGSRASLTLTGPFAKQHGLRAANPKGVVAVDGWGVGGSSRSYVMRGRELAIGPLKIPGVVTAMSLQKKGSFASPAYQGNIGGGVLKRFIVTFDYANHVMYLKPLPQPVADLDTYDRAGMWINAAKGGMEVMDVTANGPAAKAGVKTGDVITQVNGKPATSTPVYELRRMLRDELPGTVVHFTTKRGGQMRELAVTLRDQI